MEIKKIKSKIEIIKNELLKINEMRPGSLSERYNVCGIKKCRCKDTKNPRKHGPYLQLSFVHQGKNGTKFIQKKSLKKIERELEQYKKFRELTNEWIALAMECSNLELKLEMEEKDEN